MMKKHLMENGSSKTAKAHLQALRSVGVMPHKAAKILTRRKVGKG